MTVGGDAYIAPVVPERSWRADVGIGPYEKIFGIQKGHPFGWPFPYFTYLRC